MYRNGSDIPDRGMLSTLADVAMLVGIAIALSFLHPLWWTRKSGYDRDWQPEPLTP